MPFEIVRNDITKMQVDAIVNAASRFPRVNAGVDSAIHKKAGPDLLEARKEIGYIRPGTAAVTPAFCLDAQYVIHAATPVWVDGSQGEAELLRQTYDMCLDLAVKKCCRSIAFPLLASGNHGFPKGVALQAAIGSFSRFLTEQEMQIYLVVFSKDSVSLSEKLVHSVTCYIDEHYVETYELDTYGDIRESSRRNRYQRRRIREDSAETMAAPCAPMAISLNDFLKTKDTGFTETLLRLIDASGHKDSTIYKKAHVSKQHFSKIRNNPNHKPTKETAIAFALALELDVAQTNDLLGRAGYTLSNSSKFDLIIRYFIEQKKYNIVEINLALYEFDQTLLGS